MNWLNGCSKYLLINDRVMSIISSLWAICWILSMLLNLKFDGISYIFYVYITPVLALVLVIRTIIILMRKNKS